MCGHPEPSGLPLALRLSEGLAALHPYREYLDAGTYNDEPEACSRIEVGKAAKPLPNWRVWVVDDLARDIRRWPIGELLLVRVVLGNLGEQATDLKLDNS